MDKIVDIFKSIVELWPQISAVIVAFIAFATVVVKVTKTDKDDKVLAGIIKFLDYFSLVNPKGTKVVDAKAIVIDDLKE